MELQGKPINIYILFCKAHMAGHVVSSVSGAPGTWGAPGVSGVSGLSGSSGLSGTSGVSGTFVRPHSYKLIS